MGRHGIGKRGRGEERKGGEEEEGRKGRASSTGCNQGYRIFSF